MSRKQAEAFDRATAVDQKVQRDAATPEARPVAGALDIKAFHARMEKRFPKILAELAK